MSTNPNQVLPSLTNGVSALMAEVMEEPGWQILMNPASPPELVRGIMRELYCEVAAWQPDMIEAAISAIGQFPRTLAARKVRLMMVHAAEEWDHGEMAVRDSAGLGQEASMARAFQSPTAFATSACWRMFVHKRLPFAYLGAMYLMEGLTPLVAGTLTPALESQGIEPRAMESLQFHVTEDTRHTAVIEGLIRDVLLQYPEKASEVQFGFDALRHVYPLPGWRAAVSRAQVTAPRGRF